MQNEKKQTYIFLYYLFIPSDYPSEYETLSQTSFSDLKQHYVFIFFTLK